MPTVIDTATVSLSDFPYPRGSLHLRTIELLRNRPRRITYERLAEISRGCNCQPITSTWLHQYICGNIKNPDVDKVQVIYELLSGKLLTVD